MFSSCLLLLRLLSVSILGTFVFIIKDDTGMAELSIQGYPIVHFGECLSVRKAFIASEIMDLVYRKS